MSFFYHIVFRPKLEELPNFEDFEQSIKDLKGLIDYVIGCEKGISKGEEEYNHYDVVLELDYSCRVDYIKAALCKKHSISKLSQKNIKVYSIDNNRILYQIGYATKECIKHTTTFDLLTIEKGQQEYKKIGPMKVEKFSDAKWSVDEVGIEFEKWLRKINDAKDNGITVHIAETYYNEFIRANRKCISLSTYMRINKEKICTFVSDRD